MNPPLPDPSGDGLCPHCGAVVRNGQHFCSRCGALLSPSQAPASKRGFTFWFNFLPLVVFCIVAGTVGGCSTLFAGMELFARPIDPGSLLMFLFFGAGAFAVCFFLAREIRRLWRG